MFTQINHNIQDPSILQEFGIFTPAQVLVKTTVGYKPLDLYVRDSTGQVFAKNGSYLIALMRSGLTTNSKITWKELDGIDEIYDNNNLTYKMKTEEE